MAQWSRVGRVGVRRLVGGCVAAWLLWSGCAGGAIVWADEEQPAAVAQDVDGFLRARGIDAQGPEALTLREQQARRVLAEKELRRVRLKHFGTIKKTEVRQEGLAKLRAQTDRAMFPLMIDLFSREQDDVRGAMLDLFVESASREGDASLAWLALYGKDAWLRERGRSLLAGRIEAERARAQREAQEADAEGRASARGNASKGPEAGAADDASPVRNLALRHDPVDAARIVIYEGLRKGSNAVKGRAANLAADLKLIELIPWLAAAQVSGSSAGGTSGGGGIGGDGALAYIQVATQQAFVSDLEPVVSENAVAFDPQLSVVTEGTVLRVIDAVVYTYHVEINRALVRLGKEASGRDLSGLGWDYRAWMRWYRDEYLAGK